MTPTNPSEAPSRQATCSCGQLVVATVGEPIRISMCHCLACQQRTGSIFGVQARFARSQVNISGQSARYSRTGDSGSSATFHFCPHCGATVYWELEQMPNLIAVAVGSFANPHFPSPTVSVYEVRRHAWAATPPDVEHID